MRRPTLKRIIAPNASTGWLRNGTLRVSLPTPIGNGINEGLVILLGRALGDQSRLTPRLREEIRRLGIRYPNLDKLHPTLAHSLAIRSDPLAGRLCPCAGGWRALAARLTATRSRSARLVRDRPALGPGLAFHFAAPLSLHVTQGLLRLGPHRFAD